MWLLSILPLLVLAIITTTISNPWGCIVITFKRRMLVRVHSCSTTCNRTVAINISLIELFRMGSKIIPRLCNIQGSIARCLCVGYAMCVMPHQLVRLRMPHQLVPQYHFPVIPQHLTIHSRVAIHLSDVNPKHLNVVKRENLEGLRSYSTLGTVRRVKDLIFHKPMT
jgi:hypothetical protein